MDEFQNQTIQWFPGHMAKARRIIEKSLSLVDAVTEIVDARIPQSSRNPELDEIISGKPRIVLLNKSDVADEKSTGLWIEYFRRKGISAMSADCRSGRGVNAYVPLVREVLKDKIAQNEAKGMGGKPIRVMVVGIPNTGNQPYGGKKPRKGCRQTRRYPSESVVCNRKRN